MAQTRNSRRHFLKNIAAGSSVLASNPFGLHANDLAFLETPKEEIPWFKKVTRWGQINITETDPPHYDLEWWRSFWKKTNTEGVVVNAGGIVAYYPTKVPLHRKAEFLGDRDLFGEIRIAAKKDGVAVFARMDSNRAHEDFYRAHPDWFAINADGQPYKAGDLYISCINSPYYQEHIPAILTEIAHTYKPEGFTDNSWSGLDRESICYCENCKKSFRDKTGNIIPPRKNWDDNVYQQWIKWNYARRIEIWELNNHTTKTAGGAHCIWSGMNSGSISGQSRSFRDYKEIGQRADIIMLDDQSRSDASGFQHNGETGKLLHGLIGWDKLAPESMAMYNHIRPWFRLGSKPAAEARMWMINGIAGGIQPWWHMVSAYHEDRRMYQTAEPIMRWHKLNEQYLVNRTPVANIGVVWSQHNIDFYGRDDAEELVELPCRGMTQALIRARIPYLPVHADHIDRDASKLSLLILPNLAIITPGQVLAIRRFTERGGSIIATGDTSLFDETGKPLNDYLLSDLFGAHLETAVPNREMPNEKMARDAYHSYVRLTPELRSQVTGPHMRNEPAITGKRHPVLKGFEQTDIIPYGGLLHPIRVIEGAEVPMTYIPQFPTYPPEKSYMRNPKTDIPGVVIRNLGNGSRIVFIPADFDRQFARFNHPDHGNLLANTVRWAARENLPLQVEGAGLLDCHLYQQRGRLVLHIVNLTSAATWRQPLDELIAVGPFKINITLPSSVPGKNLNFLVSGQQLKAVINDRTLAFEVKSITDHEVIVIS